MRCSCSSPPTRSMATHRTSSSWSSWQRAGTTQRLLPDKPRQARFLGQQIFFFVAVRFREARGAFADDHDVRRMIHHQFRDFRWRFNAANGSDGAAPARGAVCNARIQLRDAVFIRKAAIADGGVIWVELNDVDAGDDGIEGIRALLEHLHRLLAGCEAVCAGDDDALASRSAGLSKCRRCSSHSSRIQ